MVFSLVLTAGTMTVYAGSADNSLSSLTLSEGSLSPAFEGSHLQYTATVSADTTSVEVNAKPVNSAATVTSITGNTDLAVGTNTIQVVVQAENGNLATYTIKVTRPDAAAAEPQQEEPAQQEPAQQEPQRQEEDDPEEGDDQTGDATGDMIPTETSYTISDGFKEEEIPQGFAEATVTYQGEEHKGLMCEYADITLVYMVDQEENGKFFIYDASSEDTYPFIRLSTEISSIILLRHAAPGDGYTQAELTIGENAFDCAYQQSQGDFYQVYAVNSQGVAGWYQYDAAEGSYQRYTVVTQEEPAADGSAEYLQQALGDLDEKYKARRDRDMKIIAALIVVCVIMLFVILNLLLRGRRQNQSEEEDDFEDDIFSEGEEKTESELLAEALQEEYETDTHMTDAGMMDADREDVDQANVELEDPDAAMDDTLSQSEQNLSREMDENWEDEKDFCEFEEDPQLLPGRKAKRERKKRERREKHEKVKDIFDDDDNQGSIFTQENIYSGEDSDDDLEVMDLNDL